MTTELNRAFTCWANRVEDKQLPPYFLSYSVSDATSVSIRAQFGALADSSSNHVRVADVQVRLGSPELDNTHGDHRGSAVNSLQLPLADDREALGRSLWLATNTGYGTALDNYLRVKTEAAGAGQGRRHLARLQPGGAANVYRQACSAGGGGPGRMGAAGARAVEGVSRVP